MSDTPQNDARRLSAWHVASHGESMATSFSLGTRVSLIGVGAVVASWVGYASYRRAELIRRHDAAQKSLQKCYNKIDDVGMQSMLIERMRQCRTDYEYSRDSRHTGNYQDMVTCYESLVKICADCNMI